MGKQFNIRSEKAREIAIKWSRLRNEPLSKIVEEAMVAFDAAQPQPRPMTMREVLRSPLLARAQEAVRRSKSDFEIEDLYDPETGLPA